MQQRGGADAVEEKKRQETIHEIVKTNLQAWLPRFAKMQDALLRSDSLENIFLFIDECDEFQKYLANLYLKIPGKENDVLDIVAIADLYDAVRASLDKPLTIPTEKIYGWNLILYKFEEALVGRYSSAAQEFLGVTQRQINTFFDKFTNFQPQPRSKLTLNSFFESLKEGELFISQLLTRFDNKVKSFQREEKKVSEDDKRFAALSSEINDLVNQLTAYYIKDKKEKQEKDEAKKSLRDHVLYQNLSVGEEITANNYAEIKRSYDVLKDKLRKMKELSEQIVHLKTRAKTRRSDEMALWDEYEEIKRFPEKIFLSNVDDAERLAADFQSKKFSNDVAVLGKKMKSSALVQQRLAKVIESVPGSQDILWLSANDVEFMKQHAEEIVGDILKKKTQPGMIYDISENDYYDWAYERYRKLISLRDAAKKFEIKFNIQPSSPYFINKIAMQDYDRIIDLLKKYKTPLFDPHVTPSARVWGERASASSIGGGQSSTMRSGMRIPSPPIEFNALEENKEFENIQERRRSMSISDANEQESSIDPRGRYFSSTVDSGYTRTPPLEEEAKGDLQSPSASSSSMFAKSKPREMLFKTQEELGAEIEWLNLCVKKNSSLKIYKPIVNSFQTTFAENTKEIASPNLEASQLKNRNLQNIQAMLEAFYMTLAVEFDSKVKMYTKSNIKSKEPIGYGEAVAKYVSYLNKNTGILSGLKQERALGLILSQVILSYENLRTKHPHLAQLAGGAEITNANKLPVLGKFESPRAKNS